jgi:cytochrome b pre-mRNA-processing protein 3
MILFSPEKRRRRDAAGRLYSEAVAAARDPALYLDHGVPDTFQGRFEMVTLYLFPLLYRLTHDPGDDPELARLLSEHLVADMDDSFREIGVADLKVPKRMTGFYRSFAGRIAAYGDAGRAGHAALVAALTRNIFPEGDHGGHAPALTARLEAALEAARQASLDDLRRGAFSFGVAARREPAEDHR